MEYYKNTPNNTEDFLVEGDEGVFNIKWIKDEFNRCELVSDFVGGYYWGDLHEYGFYDEVSDLYLINYIKKNDEDFYNYFIEFMGKDYHINHIREKLVYMVFEIKVRELVSLKLI